MTLRVAILAYDGCISSSVVQPLDGLRIANTLAHVQRPGTIPPIDVQLVGVKAGTAKASSGVRFDVVQARPDDFDVLLVSALDYRSTSELLERVDALRGERQLLRRFADTGKRIVANCSGSVLLAEAGVLDGRRATTSWWLASLFRQRYPNVELTADEIAVEDGPITTTGAATASYEATLRLIELGGGEALAQNVSRVLLVDRQRQSQAPYVSLALTEKPRQPLSERAERWLQKNLHESISISALADHCRVSERTLLRRFHADFDATPLEYVQKMRVERAKALLESTALSFEEIVGRCGYQDVSSFRRLFKGVTQLTPNDYRDRFRLRGR
jgi:transcriptional regulator GlxA family with amidase domain